MPHDLSKLPNLYMKRGLLPTAKPVTSLSLQDVNQLAATLDDYAEHDFFAVLGPRPNFLLILRNQHPAADFDDRAFDLIQHVVEMLSDAFKENGLTPTSYADDIPSVNLNFWTDLLQLRKEDLGRFSGVISNIALWLDEGATPLLKPRQVFQSPKRVALKVPGSDPTMSEQLEEAKWRKAGKFEPNRVSAAAFTYGNGKVVLRKLVAYVRGPPFQQLGLSENAVENLLSAWFGISPLQEDDDIQKIKTKMTFLLTQVIPIVQKAAQLKPEGSKPHLDHFTYLLTLSADKGEEGKKFLPVLRQLERALNIDPKDITSTSYESLVELDRATLTADVASTEISPPLRALSLDTQQLDIPSASIFDSPSNSTVPGQLFDFLQPTTELPSSFQQQQTTEIFEDIDPEDEKVNVVPQTRAQQPTVRTEPPRSLFRGIDTLNVVPQTRAQQPTVKREPSRSLFQSGLDYVSTAVSTTRSAVSATRSAVSNTAAGVSTMAQAGLQALTGSNEPTQQQGTKQDDNGLQTRDFSRLQHSAPDLLPPSALSFPSNRKLKNHEELLIFAFLISD